MSSCNAAGSGHRSDCRIHFREGDCLVDTEPVDGWIHRREISGFKMRIEWLDPADLPQASACLAAITAG